MTTQFGESLTGDFEEKTWTFEMPEDFTLKAGEFAIVPKAEYEAMVEFMNQLKPSDSNQVKKYLIQIKDDFFNRMISEIESMSSEEKAKKVRIEIEKIVSALEGDTNYIFLPDEFTVSVNNEEIKIYPLEPNDQVLLELEEVKPCFNAELILTLESKNEWVRKVPRHLPEKNYYNEQFIWIDANGNTLVMGEDFAAAERMDSYPVRVYRHIRVSDAEKVKTK